MTDDQDGGRDLVFGGGGQGWLSGMCGDPVVPVGVDATVPHTARMYDYFLGGKDHFAADREAAGRVLEAFPNVRDAARANRACMARMTRFLARQGVRQFLDIGTGLPTSPNVHEVAQSVAPDARVLYVDHDPVVLTHARALLTSTPEGRTACLQADLRDPVGILTAPELHAVLDLAQPVALSLIAVLHFLPDTDDPYTIVARLMDALAPGSYLALTHVTGDFAPRVVEAGAAEYRNAGLSVQPRTRGEVARFLTGLDLIPPGLEVVTRWQRDPRGIGALLPDEYISCYGAVARKPDQPSGANGVAG